MMLGACDRGNLPGTQTGKLLHFFPNTHRAQRNPLPRESNAFHPLAFAL